MLNSSLYSPTTPSVACTQLKKAGKESSLAICNKTSTSTTNMSPLPLQSSTEACGLALVSPESDPHAPASYDPTTGNLRKPHRVRMLRRSWSSLMPGSRSLEALIEKTKATLTGRNEDLNLQAQDLQKVQRVFSAKTLPKSVSQGSVASDSPGGSTGASALLQETTAPRLEVATWKCRAPFSHCFLRRKPNTQGGHKDREMPSHAPVSKSSVSAREKENPDCKSEKSNTSVCVDNMSLEERLAHIHSMKGKTYSLHTGFAIARKDALDMMGVFHYSETKKSDVPETADTETCSQLLFAQAKVLSGACSRMATEYSSPEELLLTLTHSFHSLCCLMQACMSLVESLNTESERREVVAKVDEVIVNYACLLKAAEVAAAGSPSDQTVNALTHYSATMSVVINTLSHSLETSLNNKLLF